MARTGVSPIGKEEAWLDALLQAPLRLPLFARGTLQPGWRQERRVIPEHLIYFVTASICAGRVGGSPVELAAGSLLWIPPGVFFEFFLVTPQRPITLLRFRLEIEASTTFPSKAIVLPRAWSLRPAMDGILDELTTNLPYREPRVRAHLVTLFSGIFRGRIGTKDKRPMLTTGQSQRLAEYVGARWRERPRPADLAAELRLSPDYFSRIFRRTFGLPPRSWLTRERVRHAAMRLLDSDVNASEVAEEHGYPDVFTFSRQFKKIMDCSPRTYRKKFCDVPAQ